MTADTTTTVRVSRHTRDRIAALAEAAGRPMTSILEDALEAYVREAFWDAFEEGYERLADDESAWRDLREERRGEEGVLRDGVDDDGNAW